MAVVLAISWLNPSAEMTTPVEVAVPSDHRVLSMPIDERVPLLEPGDSIDLYLGTEEFAGIEGEVEVVEEPGLVTSVTDSAFSVAVPEDEVALIASALRTGGVLVVRR